MNAKQLVVTASMPGAECLVFNFEDAKIAMNRLFQLSRLLPLDDDLEDKIQTVNVCVASDEEVTVVLDTLATRGLFDTLAYGICADLNFLRSNLVARNREKAMASAARLAALESVVLENRLLETVLSAVQNGVGIAISFHAD